MKRYFSLLILLSISCSIFSQRKIIIKDSKGKDIFKEYLWKLDNITFSDDSCRKLTDSIPSTGVDLALPSGVLWSPINIGAIKATDPGCLAGWGDTTTVITSKNLDYYPTSNVQRNISTTKFDIAKSNWGADWRMPKNKDFNELLENCKFTFVNNVDSLGFLVVGSNQNSIFLPFTGQRMEEDTTNVKTDLNYWSGTLSEDNTEEAYTLYNNTDSTCIIGTMPRFYGLAVRPVSGFGIPQVTLSCEIESLKYNQVVLKIYANGDFSDIPQDGYVITLTNNETQDKENQYLADLNSEGYESITFNDLSELTSYTATVRASFNGSIIAKYETQFETPSSVKIGRKVDMGVPKGYYWSDINLGATSDTDAGEFYVWGDPTGENILHGASDEVLTMSNISGTEYDIAHVKWKDNWCIPTDEQYMELVNNCEEEFIGKNSAGIPMVKLISKITGDSIIIVEAGYIDINGDTKEKGYNSRIWSSAALNGIPANLWYRYTADPVAPHDLSANCRMNIRPIYKYDESIDPGENPGGVDEPGDNPSGGEDEPSTDPESPDAGKAVDLGLSVLWADRNLGASNEMDYGNYYAWGDTIPNPSGTYTKYDYIWYNAEHGDTLTLYNYVGNISATELDAARHNWQGKWRMPTEKELKDLVNGCNFAWQEYDGINPAGVWISNKNDSSKRIFLPAAGYMVSTSNKVNEFVRIWSSIYDTLDSSHVAKHEWSYSLQLSSSVSNGVSTANIQGEYRYHGLPIRPVRDK